MKKTEQPTLLTVLILTNLRLACDPVSAICDPVTLAFLARHTIRSVANRMVQPGE